eukprot:428046-Prorocentrum_minimum.AAC.3
MLLGLVSVTYLWPAGAHVLASLGCAFCAGAVCPAFAFRSSSRKRRDTSDTNWRCTFALFLPHLMGSTRSRSSLPPSSGSSCPSCNAASLSSSSSGPWSKVKPSPAAPDSRAVPCVPCDGFCAVSVALSAGFSMFCAFASSSTLWRIARSIMFSWL